MTGAQEKAMTSATVTAMHKVFIVGQAGTTGLRIYERLAARPDIEVLTIDEEKRKDTKAIADLAAEADVVFLCLPDAAANDVVDAIGDLPCRIIDASTAHRTTPGWAYGFAELSDDYRKGIATTKHIAVPGCHASGMVAILHPLVKAGIVPATYPVTVTSLTGYSGGGKSMIADYESADKSQDLYAPRHYGMGQMHKHLKEVVHHTGLGMPPIFMPIVDDYYSGMIVSIGFQTAALHGTAADVETTLKAAYKEAKLITVEPLSNDGNAGCMAANTNSGKDSMIIKVTGNEDRVVVHAIFDNLGKGASGAAVQCMNIALGLPETTGLAL